MPSPRPLTAEARGWRGAVLLVAWSPWGPLRPGLRGTDAGAGRRKFPDHCGAEDALPGPAVHFAPTEEAGC